MESRHVYRGCVLTLWTSGHPTRVNILVQTPRLKIGLALATLNASHTVALETAKSFVDLELQEFIDLYTKLRTV